MPNRIHVQSTSQSILIRALAVGLCLSAIGAVQAAEAIYKSTDANGEISYSWRPDPGAIYTETIEINTLTPEQRRAMARLRQDEFRAKQDAGQHAAGLEDRWAKADDEIERAQAALQNAESALKSGRTPLPGERRGNKDGYSRLTQAYFDRIHGLELGVERAHQRLEQAYDARNGLK